ncbi:MAG TPA: serine hydrolase domain-containing protein, partial [Gemmatimonadaceae bacterium]|nr:serine hydrolase domain-containing protein [Gemmatimonadaceae bacterium]
AKGYGLASLELSVPISSRTVFDIGSSSKQFTAASIVLLAQDGKLSLDDDIRKFIPELPYLGTKVTLRHLLTHTSGWRDYVDLMFFGGFDGRDHTTDDDALGVLRRQRTLNFIPGSDWRYSNTGFFLMSVVVKRVTGKSLADFARERIFQPLGMTNTHYLTDSREVVPNKSTAYSPAPGGGFVIDMSNWEQIGDGGVQTTVEDLARWDANFDAPSAAVGGKALVDLLETTAKLSDGTPLTYALGLTVDEYRGLRRVQHGGAWGGFRAMTMRFPSEHLSVYTLCNRGDANTDQLASGVAGVFLPAQPATLAGTARHASIPGDATRFAGAYFAEGMGQMLNLDAHGDSLVQRGNHLALEPLGPGRYRHVPTGATLTFSDRGIKRVVAQPRGPGANTVYYAVQPAGQIHAADYAGSYSSDEMPAAWEIVAHGDTLLLHQPRGEDVPIRPLFRDAFVGPGILRFERDAAGKVIALTVTTRGIHALRMARQPSR